MAGSIGSAIAHWGTRLGFASALIAGTMVMAGLPVRLPASDKPTAARPKPQPIPVAAPVAPVQDPAAYVIRGALTLDGPLRHGDYVWDDSAAPQGGPILITVDLEAQMLSVFRGGYEIGVAVIAYGAGDKPTPLGSFAITQKDADHVSNLYDAPMPYMQRLTDDGISIHGTAVIGPDRATHGCIGLPTEFAKLLFGQTKLGDRVVITSGEILQVGAGVPVT